jgi:5-methylcytosine-specific restriction endonuclease McrA
MIRRCKECKAALRDSTGSLLGGGRWPNKKYCSKRCWNNSNYANDPLRRLASQRKWREKRVITIEERVRKAANERRRYARRRNVVVVQYDSIDIYERDGWICYICDQPIDPNIKGSHQDSASIDHIIPISLGGDDGPWNVGAAHRRCNSSKGNKLVVVRPKALMVTA